MKIKLNTFTHRLLSKSHKEFVLLPSPQIHYYDKVIGNNDWTLILSVKFIIWEMGLNIIKSSEFINTDKKGVLL